MLKLLNDKGLAIHAINDWTQPKRSYQWADARSAKELARAWCLEGSEPEWPSQVRMLLDSHPLTRSALLIEGRPQHVTPLPERGEGRNHDFWIRVAVNGAPLTICVEAKTDEPTSEPGKVVTLRGSS